MRPPEPIPLPSPGIFSVKNSIETGSKWHTTRSLIASTCPLGLISIKILNGSPAQNSTPFGTGENGVTVYVSTAGWVTTSRSDCTIVVNPLTVGFSNPSSWLL